MVSLKAPNWPSSSSMKRLSQLKLVAHRKKRKLDTRRSLADDIASQVEVLVSCEVDRVAVKGAIEKLINFTRKKDAANLIVECGAVPHLVRHLQSPKPMNGPIALEYEVERKSAFALRRLFDAEHNQVIVDAGALPHLVRLLKRYSRSGQNPRAVTYAIIQAIKAINDVAFESSSIEKLVRIEGGIPPLVELLDFEHVGVQRAALAALLNFAHGENDENRSIMVECNILPKLILMLNSYDAKIPGDAIYGISLFIGSSSYITKLIRAGALQPVLELLRSGSLASLRHAACILGKFAESDRECCKHIVQRGALKPLIRMLHYRDVRECSAFALARLASDTQNQAGIAYCGGVKPLLKLLVSKHPSFLGSDYSSCLYAAKTLSELANNEHSAVDLIKFGGVQKLQDGEFTDRETQDYVALALKRLEDMMIEGGGHVLNHLLHLIRGGNKAIQRRVILALAHLCSLHDLPRIFIDKNGLGLLFNLLEPASIVAALSKLSKKASISCPIDVAPPSVPRGNLGEQFVNSPTLSDITFLVEGKPFYAHRICLFASSDAFRAMFDGGYREREAEDIVIPNYTWQVFELMMRYIYTGSVSVTCLDLNVTQDLLRAADQYLLDGLKRLCERKIAEDVSAENVALIFDQSLTFNSTSLRDACILFILENYQNLSSQPDYLHLIQSILPVTRQFFVKALSTLIKATPWGVS